MDATAVVHGVGAQKCILLIQLAVELCPSAGLGDLGAARGSCRLQGGWAAPGAEGLSYSTGSKVCQQSCGLAEAPAC